jgi:PAS domain S-box-containing protein
MRYALALAVVWTLVVGASLLWNMRHEQHEVEELARAEARSAFNKDIAYRQWSAGHGGVYAPETEDTPPNPYLSHVEERDIATPSGLKLTLMNPAYMTRQVHELGAERFGIRSHITSLKPLRPENAPDDWEAGALQAFEQGETEKSSIETVNGDEHLRLMRPLVTEDVCLKCHEQQGYEVGDIRGGISLSVPMAHYRSLAMEYILPLAAGHGVLWVLGLAVLGLGAVHLRRQVLERGQAEEQLRQSEERLRHTLENTSVGMVLTAPDGRFLECNRSFCSMMGYSCGEILKMSFPDITHPDDVDKSLRLKDRLLGGEANGGFEKRYVRKDGSIIFANLRVSVVKDDRGKPLYFVSEVEDITERIQTEEALRETRSRLRLIVEQLPAVAWTVDRELRFTSSLGAGLAGLGLKADQVVGITMYEYLETDDPENSVIDGHLRALKGERVRYLFEFKGRVFDSLVEPFKDTDGNIVGCIGIAHDITEQRKTEITLQRSELELHVRNRLAEAFLTVTDEKVFGEVLQIVLDTMKSKHGVFGYVDERGDLVRPSMTRDIWDQCKIPAKDIVFPRDAWGGIWGRALREKKTLYSNEPYSVPEGHFPVRRSVVVPIVHKETVVGLFHIANKESDYDEEDRGLLETIAEYVSPILYARLQHQQAEKARRESEEKFRKIFESTNDGILVANAETKQFHTGNRTICQMLGHSLEELQRLGVKDIHPEKDLPHVLEQFEKLLQGEIAVASDIPVKRKDGSIFYCEITSSSLMLAGKTYLAGVFRDITERKRAEEDLRISKEALDNSTDAIGMSTPQGRHYYQNEAFDQLFGEIGDNPPETVYVDKKVGEEVFKSIMAGGQWTGEVKMYAKDSRILDIFLRAYANKEENGNIVSLVGIHTDITEYKRAEEALRENEDRFRSLIESSQDGILAYDKETRYTLWNPEMERMSGMKAEDVVGKNAFELFPFLEETGKAASFREAIEGEANVRPALPYCVPETGREGYSESSHFPLRDSQGNITGGMGIIRDVTERVLMEEQLRQATKMEAVGQLAGGVAHDFNNSLMGINLHCSLALDAIGKNTERTRQCLLRILDACERAAGSIRRLLAFGRRQVQETSVVNLNGVLREFVPMFRRLVGEDIEFSIEPAEDLGNARVDAGQIEEAVINLITNARDAMPEGGKLVLKSANVTLDEEFTRTHAG